MLTARRPDAKVWTLRPPPIPTMRLHAIRRAAVALGTLAVLGCGSDVLSPAQYARMTALVEAAPFEASFGANDAVGTLLDNGSTVDMIGQEQGSDGSWTRIRLQIQGFHEPRRLIGGFFEFRARQTTSTRTLDVTQVMFNGLLAR